MKYLLLTFMSLLLLSGCSAKEFNAGAESIGNDISNAFEGSRDKSTD